MTSLPTTTTLQESVPRHVGSSLLAHPARSVVRVARIESDKYEVEMRYPFSIVQSFGVVLARIDGVAQGAMDN